MKQKIIDNIHDPDILEALYRENRQEFSKAFAEVSETVDTELVKFWKIRLAPERVKEAAGFNRRDLIIVLLLSLVTGLLVKLPAIFCGIHEEAFYKRDLAIIIFNGIILYTFWQSRSFTGKRLMFYGAVMLVMLLFVNFLPYSASDSIVLSFIHIPLFLWCLFGLVFIGFDFQVIGKRISFIRFNGELLIMMGLILIAGGILAAVTMGLFHAIKMDIEKFYFDWVVTMGAAAIPIVAFYLLRLYPNITNRLAPVIAIVFTPLVLITLAVYLTVMLVSTDKLLADRNLLILFNAMLLGVMVIIVFSVSELDKLKEKNFNVLVLFLLALLAIVINGIALMAITSRVLTGLTPNRTIVLVSNILIFVNLILIAKNLFLSWFRRNPIERVEEVVARYLTVYTAWTLIVIFVLPFVFRFR